MVGSCSIILNHGSEKMDTITPKDKIMRYKIMRYDHAFHIECLVATSTETGHIMVIHYTIYLAMNMHGCIRLDLERRS